MLVAPLLPPSPVLAEKVSEIGIDRSGLSRQDEATREKTLNDFVGFMPFGFVTDRPPARRSVDLWEGVPDGFAGSMGRLDGAGQALAAIAAFLS